MKKKSIFVLFSSLVLGLGILTACSTDKKEAQSDTNISSTISEVEEKSSSSQSDSSETSESSTEEEQVLEMDIAQIQQGNYQSVNGTWENGVGQSVEIKGDTLIFTDITNQKQSGEINGLSINIPSMNDESGQPKLVDSFNEKKPAYVTQLEPIETDGLLSLKSEMPGAVIYVSFLPKGTMGGLLDGDINQDKILAIGTQNNPTAAFGELVYYKVE
ncbi:MAG: DUF6287 domain-containing protein [Vagococcus fluvialis]